MILGVDIAYSDDCLRRTARSTVGKTLWAKRRQQGEENKRLIKDSNGDGKVKILHYLLPS
jgi:choline kinase